MSKKVTLIMPCYNAEPYIDVMLSSVYSQIHDDIELICVDDGSTDCTRAKLDAWKPLMEKRGYTMIIVSKSNGGSSSAINAGLGLITGEYVCFPDADDMLMSGYVSEMLEYLETHSDEKWVMCDTLEAKDTPEFPPLIVRSESYSDWMDYNFKYLVEHFLAFRVYWSVWKLMIRTDFLRQCIPTMQIEESPFIQEPQINLPLAYGAPLAYLDKPLYLYFSRKEGITLKNHGAGYAKAMAYSQDACYDVALKTLDKLDASIEQKTKWHQVIDIWFNLKCFQLATGYQEDTEKARFAQKQLKLISHVLGDEISEKLINAQSSYALWFYSECALDKLIYAHHNIVPFTDESKRKVFENLKNRRIFLYGAGEVGRSLLPALIYVGIKPEGIWDTNAELNGTYLLEVPISTPDLTQITSIEKAGITVILCIQKREFCEEAEALLSSNGMTNIIQPDDLVKMLRAAILDINIKSLT